MWLEESKQLLTLLLSHRELNRIERLNKILNLMSGSRSRLRFIA